MTHNYVTSDIQRKRKTKVMTVQYITKTATRATTVNVGAEYTSDSSERALSFRKSAKNPSNVVVELTNEDGDTHAIVIKQAAFKDLVAKARAAGVSI